MAYRVPQLGGWGVALQKIKQAERQPGTTKELHLTPLYVLIFCFNSFIEI